MKIRFNPPRKPWSKDAMWSEIKSLPCVDIDGIELTTADLIEALQDFVIALDSNALHRLESLITLLHITNIIQELKRRSSEHGRIWES